MPARKQYQKGDIINFNKIIELDVEKTNKFHRAYWKCECLQCHKIRSVRQDSLTHICRDCSTKNRKSNIFDDLTGKTFSNWTVLKKADKTNYWTCKCKCGTIKDIFRGNLTQGTSKSCGCINSWGETQLIQLLNKYKICYKTQITFPDLITDKGGYPRFDFAIFNNLNQLQCLIEYDGRQHYNYDKNWKMNKEDYVRLQYIDNLKNQYCKKHNLLLYRLNKNDNLENFVQQLKQINKGEE